VLKVEEIVEPFVLNMKLTKGAIVEVEASAKNLNLKATLPFSKVAKIVDFMLENFA